MTRGPPHRCGVLPQTHNPTLTTRKRSRQTQNEGHSTQRLCSPPQNGHGPEKVRESETPAQPRGDKGAVTLNSVWDLDGDAGEPSEISSLRCRQQEHSTPVSQFTQMHRGYLMSIRGKTGYLEHFPVNLKPLQNFLSEFLKYTINKMNKQVKEWGIIFAVCLTSRVSRRYKGLLQLDNFKKGQKT